MRGSPRRRFVLAALAAIGSLVPLALPAPAGAAGSPPAGLAHRQSSRLSPAEVARLAAQANLKSIVIFKNQHPELPPRPDLINARSSAVDSDQAAVKDELSQLHAGNIKSFHVVNAVAATISKAEADRLAASPVVQAVVPDAPRKLVVPERQPASASASPAGPGALPSAAELQQICPPDPKVPLLEPEALQVMNVEFQPGTGRPAAHNLVDGTGIRVGIIADGLDPNDPDLIRNGKSIVFDYQDFSGFGNNAPTDGREAFLDSGAIASQGNATYDLSKFVNPAHPLPPGCNIRIKGVAPGASLAIMNAFEPAAFNSQIVQAIDRLVTVDQVDILNESFGANTYPDEANDPTAIADNNAVAAGVTVVVSTGDSGPTNTIGSPASDPGVINAGGSTTYRVYRQATRYGVQLDQGGWESNNITALSSAGTTQLGPRTVDVVAPGDRGWELCSTDVAHFFGCRDFDNGNIGQPIWAAGGTSLSAPLTSGTAALVIEAFEKTHHGARPSPELVKRIIVSTAQDLGAPAIHQGAGLVDGLKAVQLAESIADGNGSPAPKGSTLLASRPALVKELPAGTAATFQVDVTNAGTGAQTVSPSVVKLADERVSDDTGSVTLGTGSQTFIDDRGRVARYRIHQFTVPSGADYLNGDITWNAQLEPGSAAFETVFDPSGRVAAYSLISSDATGYGHVEVRRPAAGTWTAAIWTVSTSQTYSGTVRFDYFTQRFTSAGSVLPAARTLAPGQTAGFTVTVPTPIEPGDLGASLRLTTGGSGDGSIPIVVRGLVAIGSRGGTFRGVLTGGPGTIGQEFTYQFDIPAGRPVLDLALKLRDPNYNVDGFLVGPDGQPLDIQSTAVVSQGQIVAFGSTLQFFERAPTPGRWTVVVSLGTGANAQDGARFREPFTGRIGFAPLPVAVTGIPDSPFTVLKRGGPVKATVTLTNSGNSGKDFFIDARLDQRAEVPLLGADVNAVPLPLSLLAQPNWLVPPSSDQLLVVARGSVPIVMDISALFGNPDLLGVSLPGNFAVAQATAPEVAPGLWFGLPAAVGPFPPGGLFSASVNLAAVANTNAFDRAVSAGSGNAWLALGVDPSTTYTPLTLAPGQSGTITLTITPTAPKGTLVRGFAELETFNPATASGDEIVVIPYTYKVG